MRRMYREDYYAEVSHFAISFSMSNRGSSGSVTNAKKDKDECQTSTEIDRRGGSVDEEVHTSGSTKESHHHYPSWHPGAFSMPPWPPQSNVPASVLPPGVYVHHMRFAAYYDDTIHRQRRRTVPCIAQPAENSLSSNSMAKAQWRTFTVAEGMVYCLWCQSKI